MLLEIIILLLAIPVGFLIAYLARDELVQGRKWFRALIVLFGLLAVIFFALKLNVEGFTSVFIVVFSAVSYWKSFNKRWTTKSLNNFNC